jgi:hypothetical protein
VCAKASRPLSLRRSTMFTLKFMHAFPAKKKEVHACLSRKKKKFMHAYLQKGTAFRWMVNLTAAKTDV